LAAPACACAHSGFCLLIASLALIPAAAQETSPGDLIDTLTTRAHAFSDEGDFANALKSLEEAAEISRREFGLFNENLVDIQYQLFRTAQAAGEWAVASDYHTESIRITWRTLQEAVRNAEASAGHGSQTHLDATLALAHWLASQTGLPTASNHYSWSQAAREIYVDALDLIDDEFGRNPKLRVAVLRQMAEDVGSFTRTQSAQVYSEMSGTNVGSTFTSYSEPQELVRAERIARRMPDYDPVLHAEVLRDIGDWRLKAGRMDLAAKSYLKAWRALDKVDGGTRDQRDLFEQPEIVRGGSLGASNLNRLFVSDSDIPNAASGAVEVEVLVDETGSARNVRVISANPYWASQSAVNMIASAGFRPRFEDREFVPAKVRYTWEFQYDPVEAGRLGLFANSSD